MEHGQAVVVTADNPGSQRFAKVHGFVAANVIEKGEGAADLILVSLNQRCHSALDIGLNVAHVSPSVLLTEVSVSHATEQGVKQLKLAWTEPTDGLAVVTVSFSIRRI
jgi:hypothetical protein